MNDGAIVDPPLPAFQILHASHANAARARPRRDLDAPRARLLDPDGTLPTPNGSHRRAGSGSKRARGRFGHGEAGEGTSSTRGKRGVNNCVSRAPAARRASWSRPRSTTVLRAGLGRARARRRAPTALAPAHPPRRLARIAGSGATGTARRSRRPPRSSRRATAASRGSWSFPRSTTAPRGRAIAGSGRDPRAAPRFRQRACPRDASRRAARIVRVGAMAAARSAKPRACREAAAAASTYVMKTAASRAIRGDLPLASGIWEGPDVDFISLRLIRNIRQPLAVRREFGKTLVEFRVQIRERLTIAKEWQQPDVGSSLGILYFLDDITSIPRPIHRVLDPCVFIQDLVLGDTTGSPLVHVEASAAK